MDRIQRLFQAQAAQGGGVPTHWANAWPPHALIDGLSEHDRRDFFERERSRLP